MKRVLYLFFAVVGLAILGAAGAAFIMSDHDLEKALKSVPGADTHTDQVVDAKRNLSAGAANWFDDTLYSITSTWRDITDFSPTNRTPRVIIELEPVRTPVEKYKEPAEEEPVTHDAPTPEPSEAGTARLTAAPAAPPMPAPEPAPMTSHMAEPEKTEPAKAVEPAHVPAPPEPQEMVAKAEPAKVLDAVSPPIKPAKPEPVKKAVKEKKAASHTKAPEPAPPPAAPKPDNGSADHKKGLAYYKGIGVTKNFKTAKKYFEQAAEKGHADAQYNLGIMSYLGQGTEQDYSKAADWFRMAAEQDHALAQYNLGFLYYGGKGVAKDDLQAFMWIDRAAGLGDKKAIKARDALAKILPKDIFKKK